MLGWSISARAWRSASKRAMTSSVSMPGLMTLRATLAADGLVLLGHEDDAHAAFADFFQELVGTDARSRPFRRWLVVHCANRRRFQPIGLLFMHFQKCLDALGQDCVVAACLLDEQCTGIQITNSAGGVKQGLFVKRFGDHAILLTGLQLWLHFHANGPKHPRGFSSFFNSAFSHARA